MDTITLTYDEIAEQFGISGASARNLVRRKRWKRITGNDGRARIEVPAEAMRDAPQVAPSEPPQVPPSEAPQEGPSVAVMMARLDAEIAGLKALVEAERVRADAAERDRDRWHELAVRPWWKRLVG